MKNFTLHENMNSKGYRQTSSLPKRRLQGTQSRGIEVLIVDSESKPAEALRDSLMSHSFMPTVVHSARAAWKAASAAKYTQPELIG